MTTASSLQRPPSFSVVINTLNRAESLKATLESFRWLRYRGEFEVIVVNGPSNDHTKDIIAAWSDRIRSADCPVANLSVSRNIGICLARAEIIAFIDDDAIAEPEWLEQLSAAYCDPQVGAVGGFVYDHTGYTFQYQFCTVDRFANADLSPSAPKPQLCYPKSYRFPHLLGANSSFRTSALMEIGGFDEEYEYFLDETDVCLRIVDAGYLIVQLDRAFVHHKFAPSNLRGKNRVALNRFPIIKNKIYFSLKHAREFHNLEEITFEYLKFIEHQKNEMQWALENGLINEQHFEVFVRDVDRALEVGLRRGLEGVLPGAMIDDSKRSTWKEGEFFRFPTLACSDCCTLVLVSKDFPPNHGGGIATFNKDLAEAFAARGNIVHVITQSPDVDRVDFENGVWVHRIVAKEVELAPAAVDMGVPKHIWNWSATALEEAQRISHHRKIDVVEAPIWDCEGIAFLLSGSWPLVTSLQTTLHFWLDTHPQYREDSTWMASFGQPMLKLESELMRRSHAIRSISHAIKVEIENAYGFVFDARKTKVIPLGLAATGAPRAQRNTTALEVLFVGRLEARKGIDVLLEAIPIVLEAMPNTIFKIVGDDTLTRPDGRTFAQAFLEGPAGKKWRKNVVFAGRIDNYELHEAYANCDVFVAPSRFESFGLVFLEAMREGKPVIGCDAGGMPEIIAAGRNGELIQPGDVAQLGAKILELLKSEALRSAYGAAGQDIFRARFSAEQMAENSVALYALAVGNFAANIK